MVHISKRFRKYPRISLLGFIRGSIFLDFSWTWTKRSTTLDIMEGYSPVSPTFLRHVAQRFFFRLPSLSCESLPSKLASSPSAFAAHSPLLLAPSPLSELVWKKKGSYETMRINNNHCSCRAYRTLTACGCDRAVSLLLDVISTNNLILIKKSRTPPPQPSSLTWQELCPTTSPLATQCINNEVYVTIAQVVAQIPKSKS